MIFFYLPFFRPDRQQKGEVDTYDIRLAKTGQSSIKPYQIQVVNERARLKIFFIKHKFEHILEQFISQAFALWGFINCKISTFFIWSDCIGIITKKKQLFPLRPEFARF